MSCTATNHEVRKCFIGIGDNCGGTCSSLKKGGQRQNKPTTKQTYKQGNFSITI